MDAHLAAVALDIAHLARRDTDERGTLVDQQGLRPLRIQRFDGTGERRVELVLHHRLGEKPRVARVICSGRVLKIGGDVDDLHGCGGRNEPVDEVDAVEAVCQPHIDKENVTFAEGVSSKTVKFK